MRHGVAIVALLGLLGLAVATPVLAEPTEARVYQARKIVTMDPANPSATHVAVADGRILVVGSEASVHEALADRKVVVDDSFRDKVLLPGLIEPHLHLYIAALLLPMEIIAPHEWELLGKRTMRVRGREAYLAQLRVAEVAKPDAKSWLDTWGYHHDFHGKLSRADLDAISTTRPILVWHRSFHEIYLNTPALAALGITAESVGGQAQVDFERGRFYGTGVDLLLPRLIQRLLAPERYTAALSMARAIIHAGGVTTIGDGGFAALGFDQELQALKRAGFDSDETPFRSVLLIDGRTVGRHMSHEVARGWIESLPKRGTHRLRLRGKAVKLFAEGYLDGQPGEGIMTPEELEAAARVYWNADFQIHVRVNGDLGLEKTLDLLEKLQKEQPRKDHRFTLHDLAYARPEQTQRIARLGAIVSANPSEVGPGPERAAHMVPAVVPLAFQSDFPMAPVRPLLLAWMSATRITANGKQVAPQERISLDEELQAITIDAAYQLRMENEIGSIAAGKRADFTVLEQDPYAVPVENLKDIPIWGTVFEGKAYPLPR